MWGSRTAASANSTDFADGVGSAAASGATDAGPVLDEIEAVFGVAAHELVDQFLDRVALLVLGGQGDADQAARRGVHGGLAQLRRVHLAQTLEAADFDLLAFEHGRFQLGAMGVGAGVAAR